MFTANEGFIWLISISVTCVSTLCRHVHIRNHNMIPLSKIITKAGMIVESKRIVVCLFLTDNKPGFMLALNFSDTLEAVCVG